MLNYIVNRIRFEKKIELDLVNDLRLEWSDSRVNTSCSEEEQVVNT